MSLVLVVTRNPSLALALGGTGLDVIELRPSGLDAWLTLDDRPVPDAVVVAQPTPEEALTTLYSVRDHGVGAAALLLAAGGEAWAALDPRSPGGTPASRLLVLPVSGPELIQAVHEVIASPDSYVGAHVATPPPPEPASLPMPVPPPLEELVVPGPRVPSAHVIDLRAGEADQARLSDVRGTVRHLLESVEEVYGVPESAAVVIAEARVRVRCDAAALLLADGERWRLAASEGMTDEEAGEIPVPSSWLTSTIGPARRGLVVDTSELARERVQGMPLAGRRHLVVAPVPPARAVLVLARDDEVDFSDADVTTLVGLGEEAGPLLTAAVDARDLARALAPLRDIEPIPDRVDSSG
jgi:hypothetical protein